MSKAIGIDLGTTNSVVGLKKIDTEIINNAENEQLTPSVVSMQVKSGLLKKDKFLVGKHALNWMQQDPKNTISSIKRLMGRGFSDSEIQKLLQQGRFNFQLKPLSNASENSLCVVLNHKEYTPEQISAKILEKIKVDSEKQLQENIEYAVVTVPAYFNDKQKVATRRAAALAGLKVQRLLPEPTAAAISFGVDQLKEGEAKTVLIYDLGGGTFDISILTIADGQFIEQGKGGDMWMGGDDIDNLIRQFVYQETEKENDIKNLPLLIEKLNTADKNRFLGEIKQQVENAKIKLSTETKAYIDILGLLKDEDGDIVDIDIELDRPQFEQLLKPFVERTISLSKKLITDIEFGMDLIDQVILVGGSSNIPLVVKEIKQLFGENKVLVHPRPMLAIAEGAAILAHRLSDFYECPQCAHKVAQDDKSCPSCQFNLEDNLIENGLLDIVHSSSHNYFLELEGGKNHKLAEQNTPLPFHAHSSFKLIHPEQKLAHLKFTNEVNGEQESIGSLWLSFELPKNNIDKTNLPEILLDFEIDINNLITVSASLDGSLETKISKTLSRGGVDEQLFIELEHDIDRVNAESKDYYITHEFLHRTLNLAKQINQLIDSNSGKLNQKMHKNILKMHKIALHIYEKDESFQGNINYAYSFIGQFKHLMSEKEHSQLEKKFKLFENKTQTSGFEEIEKAKDKLFDEIDKHPLFGELMSINNASELVADTDPNKSRHLQKYITDIMAAIDANNIEKAKQLFEEILPDAYTIIDNQEKANLHIFKEIQA